MAITNYGGIVVSIEVPDRNGKLADVVLGFDHIDGYLSDEAYFGALIGRYCNRIAGGKFSLNDAVYLLPRNNGNATLHGGPAAFSTKLWHAEDISTPEVAALELRNLSPDGENGFPGNLSVRVIYGLNDENELRIDYRATCDRETIVNLTNHTYFNLAGHASGEILDHVLSIRADRITPVDHELIPTGELRSVEGTPFDFRLPVSIGSRIEAADPELHVAGGYDHNWVLADSKRSSPALASEVHEPRSGRNLEVFTTEPGLQFYSGNFLTDPIWGKGGKIYRRRSGFALETQHFPDSPNHPSFPSTRLKPGEVYTSTTIFRFSTL